MTGKSVFSGPVLVVLVVGAVAVFALSVLLVIAGPGEQQSIGTDTRSISAIGHAGIYELAQRFGIPVARSRINGIVAPDDGGLLVMAEPLAGGLSSAEIIRLGRAANVLLILPKRSASRDSNNPYWIHANALIDIGEVAATARLVEPRTDIKRGEPPASWGANRLGVEPGFDAGAQLIKSDNLTPIVGDAGNMLIGEKLDGSRRIWILSDPDIIENHGLGKGHNAAFAMALLNAMRADGGKVVFDETIHGMVNNVENPLRALLQFPYVITVLLGIAGAGLLLWATTSRFGKPRAAPPPFDLGKGRLIATTSSLLDRAGHHAFVMRRYVQVTLRDVGRLFRAPRELGDQDLAAWLDIIGEARGVETGSATILARAMQANGTTGRSLTGLFQAARDIHQWKEMISDGTPARGNARQQHPQRGRQGDHRPG